MAIITFCGESFVVDHAVKGADYVHGYDADGNLVVSLDGVSNFSGITYDGTYMTPGACLAELCNDVKYCGGALKKRDGTVLAAQDVGAAPSGYGLGGEGQLVNPSDLDALLASGWYRTGPVTVAGHTMDNVLIRVDSFKSNACIQTLYAITTTGSILRRRRYANAWQAWDWVKFPKIPAVEYRTTERWGSKPVYVTLVNYGKLPNNESKGIDHNISNIDRVIRTECAAYSATQNNSMNLPYQSGSYESHAYANRSQVKITTNDTLGTYGYSADIAVYYTKTTD